MPTPAIKYPPGVKVRRDGAICYTRPAMAGKPEHDFGVIGHVEAIRNHLPSDTSAAGDADGWFARYKDGGRVRDDRTDTPQTYGGQREAVRAVMQAQGFWPAELRPEPKYPTHEVRCKGARVQPGDKVNDFRGEAGVYEMISRIPEEGKTGKVIVGGREFYAKVWDLEIVEVPHA